MPRPSQARDTVCTSTLESTEADTVVKLDGDKKTCEVSGKSKVTVKSGGVSVVLDGDGKKLNLNADTITIKARQSLNLEGGQVKLKGNTTAVEASGTLDLKSSGMTNVKGSMVKLN